MVIAHGKTRSLPLCVLEKATGHLQRRVARDVCSQPNLYTLLDHEDPLVRGLVRYNLSLRDRSPPTDSPTYASLLELGRDPIDRETIEKTHTSSIDSEFASILHKLRSEEDLSSDETEILIRFVTFSRFRTPAWKSIYYPETRKRVQALVGPLLQDPRFIEYRLPFRGTIISAQQILEANLYQMAIIEAAEGTYNAIHRVQAKVQLLHSLDDAFFVTSDNAARPYMPDRVRRIPYEPLPGLKDPRVQITYPVGRRSCVLISSETRVPLFAQQEVKAKRVRRINSAIATAAVDQVVLPAPSRDFFEPWLDTFALPPISRP